MDDPRSHTRRLHLDGRVLAVVTPSETQHASLDHLGTRRLWTGPGGAVRRRPEHLPHGEPAISSDQKLQFTGHERDERGAGTTDDLDYISRFQSEWDLKTLVEYLLGVFEEEGEAL